MENAVQAMYMAAGTIIALMVLSVLVYMFRTGARLGENYDIRQSTAQVVKFNGQFDAYSKITNQMTNADYGYSFITKGNTASDVISCANLAMSVNEEHDFDMQNKLEIIVKVEGNKTYSVFPIKKAPRDAFFTDTSFDEANSMSDFEEDDGMFKFYRFLKKYNEARMVDIISPQYTSYGETIYKYYFDVSDGESASEVGQGLAYSDVTRKG